MPRTATINVPRRWGKGAPKKTGLSDRIIEIHQEYPHWTTQEIADVLEEEGQPTTASSVARFLRIAGLSSSRGRRRAEYELDDELQEQICELYEEGLSIRKVARAVGVGYVSVKHVLLFHGIKIRGKAKITEEHLDRARMLLEWREGGYSLQECGVDLGLTKQGAHRFEQRAREWEDLGML
jgi:transposase